MRGNPKMSKGRLEAFSDGVLAILITIMVLEVKVSSGNDLNAWTAVTSRKRKRRMNRAKPSLLLPARCGCLAPSKLEVHPYRQDGDRPAVLVVAGVVDELVVERGVD